MTAQLKYRKRERKQVEASQYYQFEAETKEEPVRLRVKFKQEQINTSPGEPWFHRVQDRTPVTINLDDLREEAILLDQREEDLGQKYNRDESRISRGNWVKRFNRLNYHNVLPDNVIEKQPAQTLTIEDFTHVAGMVASGKSTLSLLLASHVIRKLSDRRITIVVGDTQSAIKIANQINWWFCDDPENNEPVAVPVLGRSQRHKHLQGFTDSDDYRSHLTREQPHWGERWLSTVCPLQAQMYKNNKNILQGNSLKPGTEPCQSLPKQPKDKNKKATGSYYLCPFFHNCPSQQAYRDMPKARVWITAPGTMAYGGMPTHYEIRPIKIGELVYEQSDIVVFDEADTIIEWFDKVYAEQVTLTDRSRNGVFDDIGVKTEQSSRQRSPLKSRWSKAQRDAQTAIDMTLTLLGEDLGKKILQDWVQQGYFTPHVLFYKLARRLAGLEEYNTYEKSLQQLTEDEGRIRPMMEIVADFLKEDPVLRRSSDNRATTELLEIVQRINNTGESPTDEEIKQDCHNWITTFFPNTQSNLDRLKTELEDLRSKPNSDELYPYLTKEEDIDTIEHLAYRLQFTLTITLLDRHTKIVFYEWQNRPNNIREPSPHRRMPRGMLNILPLPVTGRQFGTYYSSRGSDTLSLFAYSNIGRDYVLNFHRLLTDYDGLKGPNVLALSGTSYLPDSTTFHVSDPQGVLKPEKTAQQAISQSKFAFLPQFKDDKPIRVSGNLGNKKQAHDKLTEVAKSLVTQSSSNHIVTELETLKGLGENKPELWADRDRILILVNSYDQSKWVADELRTYSPYPHDKIKNLERDNLEPDKKGKTNPGELKRADIESFANTGGKILVAPTNSIGRGFNILNNNGKAAFGAVYFFTRPYPHPNDTAAIAQELNRRAYEWFDKEDFIAWQQGDGIAHRAEILRKTANSYWRSVEHRSYYRTLRNKPDLLAFPRYDLAATTLGRIIQAVGRLIRGGVPFHGYFVDSAWADNSAKRLSAERMGEDANQIENDTEENSLLVATIKIVCNKYAEKQGSVGHALYRPLANALDYTEQLYWE